MQPILFKIGSITIYTHGLMAVLGIILGAILVYFLSKKRDLSNPYYFDLIIFTALFGIIGARIAYFFLYRDQFESSAQIFYLWQGGLISYGGFVLGGIAFVVISKLQKQPVLKWLDFITAGFFLGLLIGRIGCFLSGEYDGVLIAGERFLNYFTSVPVTLYEAVLCLLLLVVSILAISFFYERIKAGMIFFSSIIIYSLARFFIDFWRAEADWFWKISVGQVFGLILVLGAVIGIIILQSRKEAEAI